MKPAGLLRSYDPSGFLLNFMNFMDPANRLAYGRMMVRYSSDKIMRPLTKKDIKEINRLRTLLPAEINVAVRGSRDGGFVCEVLTFPGALTEADGFYELMRMINDVVCTYFDVPDKYIAYMPSYNPSVKMAQDLDGFPASAKKQVRLKLLNREKTAI